MENARDIPQKTPRRAVLISTTASFPRSLGAGDADDEQGVEAFTYGIGTMHKIKAAGFQPEELRVRNVEFASVREENGERDERLTFEASSNFPNHRRAKVSSGAEPTRAPARGSFLQAYDHRGIEIFRRIKLVIGKKQDVVLRTYPHCLASRDQQLAPVVQPNDERFKRHSCLAISDFIQHAGNVQTVSEIRKAFY